MVKINTKDGYSVAQVQGTAADIFADCACLIIEGFKIVRSLDNEYYNILKQIVGVSIMDGTIDDFTKQGKNEKAFGISFNPNDLKGGETDE